MPIGVYIIIGAIGIISYFLLWRSYKKKEWKKAEICRDLKILRRRITLLSNEIRLIKNRRGPGDVIERKSLELRDYLVRESSILDILNSMH